MDFEGLTDGERAALDGAVSRAIVKMGVFRYMADQGNEKAHEALLEYRKAHEALERALTTIALRQRFAAQDRKEAAV